MSKEAEALEKVELLLEKFRTPAIILRRPYPPIGFPKVRSRLGGLPKLPDGVDWPWGVAPHGEGPVPLHFLAQIDCAELPQIGGRLPRRGMLFFFARDDEETIWKGDPPQDSVRVIYAGSVAPDQVERPASPKLLPIRDRKQMGIYGEPAWLLPEEAGPCVHPVWPLVALRAESWPDFSAIVYTKIFADAVTGGVSLAEARRAGIEAARARRAGQQIDYPARYREAQAAAQAIASLYDRRVAALRAGAAVAATGLPTETELRPNWGRFGADGRLILPTDRAVKEPKPFPQAAIMMDRIARLLVRFAARSAKSAKDDASQAALKEIDAEARRWIERANRIGLDVAPAADEAAAFNTWLAGTAARNSQASAEPKAQLRSLLAREMERIFSDAIASCIVAAAASPRLAALIPPYFYNLTEHVHLPFEQSKPRIFAECADWRLRARVHQMLGHAPSAQEAPSVENGEVLLLQLCSDRGLDMQFGDAGAASFWIKADELAACRFDNVRGQVVGH